MRLIEFGRFATASRKQRGAGKPETFDFLGFTHICGQNIYFAYFWDDLAADKNRSLPKADRKAYIAAYSRPRRMRASWEYFISWGQATKDFAEMSQTKLTMPVLSIGGDKSLGEALGAQMKLVAKDVTIVIVKNAGHWILEEQPKQTTEALVSFL